MKVEYDLYKSPPREVDGKEVVHLHARVARSKTISIWSLGDDIQKATSLTKSDLRAVLCEMSDRFVEELQKGNCVHIDGIGYFRAMWRRKERCGRNPSVLSRWCISRRRLYAVNWRG